MFKFYLLTLCAFLFATPIIDKSLPKPEVEQMVQTAQLFYAFWDTGDPKYAREALSPDFIDQTLPEGRPQGPEGPIYASEHFRKVVPDLRCKVEEILVVGDRVIARLTFTGHHLGHFMREEPTGKKVEFRAIDIYRIKDGKITDNWHIEDNLSLFQQLNAMK